MSQILVTQQPEALVFLLVDAEAEEPAPNKEPIVIIWTEHNGWTPIEPVTELGAGWYSVEVNELDTAEQGVMIFRASAEGTREWRDIHQIVSPERLLAMTPGRTIRLGADT